MTDINPYKTAEIPDTESQELSCNPGRSNLTNSLIVGWLSSMIGPIFLTLYWLHHGLTTVFEEPGSVLFFFLVEYITPALLCIGLGIILGEVLHRAGVPIMRNHRRSIVILASFLLTYFLVIILLLTNDQLNSSIFPPPIALPTFSATCGLGVLIATVISRLGSLSATQR
jgi:hypothetical protein